MFIQVKFSAANFRDGSGRAQSPKIHSADECLFGNYGTRAGTRAREARARARARGAREGQGVTLVYVLYAYLNTDSLDKGSLARTWSLLLTFLSKAALDLSLACSADFCFN